MRLAFQQKTDQDLSKKAENIHLSEGLRRFTLDGESGPVAVCAAGPSLLKNIEVLRAVAKRGTPICAVKGVAEVLLEHGIIPKYAVFLDGKGDQLRFLNKTHKDIIYLMASQCDPSLFERLEGHDVRVWHGSPTRLHQKGDLYITGGSTVGLRAINLMRSAGYSQIHCFGFDCCIRDGETHIYKKPVIGKEMQVGVGDSLYTTTPELSIQHEQFINHLLLVKDPPKVYVHGGGPLLDSIMELSKKYPDPKRVFMDLIGKPPEGSFLLSSLAEIKAFQAAATESVRISI